MDKFIRNLEDLPKAWQEEINEGLQKYIVTQANYTREDLPSEFLAYIDGEIAKAKASMQKMVEASGYKYAVFGGISHIYVWNKERLKILEKMKEDFLNAQEATSEPQQDCTSEPEQESPKPTRMRGRPKKPFKNMMMDDADGSKLQKVKTIMHGKDGKEAALIIKACVQKGWMCKPTYKQVKDEFGDIGCRSGFNKYMSGNLTKEEIDGAINSLDLPK